MAGEVLVMVISYMQEGDSSQVFFDETKARPYMALANQHVEHANGNFSADCRFVGSAVFCKNLQDDSSHCHVHDCECSWRRTGHGGSFGRDTVHRRASSYISDLVEHLHSIHSSGSRIRMAARESCYSWNHRICSRDHLGFRYNAVFRATHDWATSD